MADNVVLNPGSGGDTLIAYQTASGAKGPASVVLFASALSPGENVLVPVSAGDPLPVVVAEGLEATVHQGGTWTVNLDSGAEVIVSGAVAATQSGPWEVELADGSAVAATQSGTWTVNLNPGASVIVSGAVAATQSGPWEVELADGSAVAATQSGTWTVSLAPGTTVNLGSGATIDLDPEAAIKLAAGTNLIGKVSAGVDAGTVYHGATAMEPRFAKIAASTTGNNAVVTAEVGHRIRVLRWGLTADGAVSVKWRSNSNDLTGERPLTKYASAGGAFSPVGIFETGGDESLFLTLSDDVAVGGELTYVLVPDLG